jgi:hypothetical protein
VAKREQHRRGNPPNTAGYSDRTSKPAGRGIDRHVSKPTIYNVAFHFSFKFSFSVFTGGVVYLCGGYNKGAKKECYTLGM